jgi:hypothetical protein
VRDPAAVQKAEAGDRGHDAPQPASVVPERPRLSRCDAPEDVGELRDEVGAVERPPQQARLPVRPEGDRAHDGEVRDVRDLVRGGRARPRRRRRGPRRARPAAPAPRPPTRGPRLAAVARDREGGSSPHRSRARRAATRVGARGAQAATKSRNAGAREARRRRCPRGAARSRAPRPPRGSAPAPHSRGSPAQPLEAPAGAPEQGSPTARAGPRGGARRTAGSTSREDRAPKKGRRRPC